MKTTAFQRTAAIVWSVVGLVLLSWSVGARIYTEREQDRVEQQAADWIKLETLYLVVAGQLQPPPGPVGKLGSDLREIPEERLDAFRGDSNRYGGISRDLGFDPFDGFNCEECGPLDREVASDIRAIKFGAIARIQAEHSREIDPAGTGSPPGTWPWLVWLVSLPAVFVVTYLRQRRSEESRYRDFSSERVLLQDLRTAQREVEGSNAYEYERLGDLADLLQEQIEKRVSYREIKKRDMRLEALTTEAESALSSIEAGNKELN